MDINNLTIKELAEAVQVFAEEVAPQMGTVAIHDDPNDSLDDDGELLIEFLSVKDTLATWLQLPDSGYKYLFCGWMLGKGIPLDAYTPSDVHKAVCLALTGSENSVMFDDGDYDAKKVLN